MPINYSGDDVGWTLAVPIPTDGERINEANCAPAWRANADRSAYLYRVVPKIYHWEFAPDDIDTDYFFQYGLGGDIEDTFDGGNIGGSIIDGYQTDGYVDVPGCVVGDKILVTSFCNFYRSTNMTKPFDLWLDAVDNYAGTPGAQTHIPGANWSATAGMDADFDAKTWPVSLTGVWTVAAAGTTRIAFAFQSLTMNGSDIARIYGGANIVAIRYPEP